MIFSLLKNKFSLYLDNVLQIQIKVVHLHYNKKQTA